MGHLISIRDRRLKEPIESPYRMTAVCAQIPSSIDDVELGRRGCYKYCYANFIKILDCSQADQSSAENEEFRNRSPRKMKSTDKLLSAEYVFCEKKKCDNNSKLKKLCSFKHRDTSWQSTEPKALELCDTQLYQFVQEEDLFAREAQYHASCENQFKLNCLKYQKSKEKASESLPPSTEQSKIITANQDVLTFVVHEIQSSLNQSNKIVQLSYLLSQYILKLKENLFSCPQFHGGKLRQLLSNYEVGIRWNYNANLTVVHAVNFAYQ